MAVTHHFNNENDLSAGGVWFDDYGRKICSWAWDAKMRILTVETGPRGRTLDLSQHTEQNFTLEKLKQRLPDLAISAAEDINKQKYRN